MKKITVRLGERSYDILIGKRLIERTGPSLKKLKIGRDAIIITNPKIKALFGKRLSNSLNSSGISSKFLTVPDAETSKSYRVAFNLLNKIAQYDKKRMPFIIALGGGVVGDLGGFVASSYKRGIPYIHIPTTLLGQVDSAIGGKVAIDLSLAKNMVGSFYQPKLVISDISTLRSLSLRQLRSGLTEVIKYGVIKDANLFSYLEKNYEKILSCYPAYLEHIVSVSSRIKARVVESDEYDRKGKRVILNYGHTLGHAMEAAAGYSGILTHGEAVAIGMIIAAELSYECGLCKIDVVKRTGRLIKAVGLPVTIKNLPIKKILQAYLHDKKFIHGTNRFVVPIKIGKVKVVENIPISKIKGALSKRIV